MAGATEYVHQKNGIPSQVPHQSGKPGGKSSADDLKYRPKQLRSKDKAAQSAANIRNKRVENNGAPSTADLEEDGWSDVSTTRMPAGAQVDQRGFREPLSRNEQKLGGVGPHAVNDFEDEPFTDHSSESDPQGLGQAHIATVKEEQFEHDQNGIIQRYMQGDSYPPTTSGQPSDVGEHELGETVSQDPRARQQQQTHRPAIAQHGHPLTRGTGDVNERMQEVGQGFLFARPGQNKPAGRGTAPAAQKQPQSILDPRSNVATNNTAQQVPLPINLLNGVPQQPETQRRTAQATHQPNFKQYAAPEHIDRHATAAAPFTDHRQLSHRNAAPAQMQGRASETIPPRESSSPQLNFDGHDSQEYDEEHQPATLDYDLEDLIKMGLDEVQAMSFDDDPTTEDVELPAEYAQASSEEKLAGVMKLDSRVQAGFFAGLSLDEWEQAGDWFLGRFGDVVKQLKDVRQERRRVAMQFESEVKQRDDLVSRKRKQLDESLSDMKETGGRVLAGTPKKKSKMK